MTEDNKLKNSSRYTEVLEGDEPELSSYTSESEGPVGTSDEPVRRPSASAPASATRRRNQALAPAA